MIPNVAVNLSHHVKGELCTSRAAYRQGKKLTSVKVYTVNKESQHLLIYNVPAINIDAELQAVCQRYGTVTVCERVSSQDVEDFTIAYHVRFEKVYEARLAKRKMDDLSFFGGILHVCYAPELETVEETKEKLSTRRKEVSFHLKKLEFPQQFKPKRGAKRNFQSQVIKNPSDYLNTDNMNFTKEIPELLSPSQPGPSKLQPIQYPTVDVKPFKKLLPTKVGKIVFHNKIT